MFAVVTDGNITSFPHGNRGIQIGDIKYPAAIYTIWSEAERNAIGIYTVEIDDTNKKNGNYYNNGTYTHAYDADAGTVTATYGSATAKNLDDTTSGNDGGVKVEGLKTTKKNFLDRQCGIILKPSDWRVIKEQETGDAMDSDWKTWRAAVRTKCNSMQTQITNAANIDAFEALFTYTKQDNGSITRPIGELPEKE